jgi:hypothetical protein
MIAAIIATPKLGVKIYLIAHPSPFSHQQLIARILPSAIEIKTKDNEICRDQTALPILFI